MRRQEKGEPVDLFITSLYWLTEQCNYNDLHDEMTQDQAYEIQIYQRNYKLIQNYLLIRQ